MRCRVNFTGQSKGVVPNITIETDDGVIDQNISNSVLEEAKRVYIEAERFCITRMK